VFTVNATNLIAARIRSARLGCLAAQIELLSAIS
jgi:hypothetical protein